MKDVMLSVVIPSYNEIENLRKDPLMKVKGYLDKQSLGSHGFDPKQSLGSHGFDPKQSLGSHGFDPEQSYSYEVIIVDDGSNDGSREFVEKFVQNNKNFRIIKNDHMGKASTVTSGVLEAKGDYILFSDMDQATPIEEVEKLFPYFEDGYDVVIGSRAGTRKGAPLSRKIMAEGMIVLRSLLVGIGEIKDTQCGFKMFTKKSAIDVFERVKKIHHGFKSISGSSVTAGFDIEILYIAKKLGYKIKEVPVEWKYVETRRVSAVKDSIEGFTDLLRIRKKIISGAYSK